MKLKQVNIYKKLSIKDSNGNDIILGKDYFAENIGDIHIAQNGELFTENGNYHKFGELYDSSVFKNIIQKKIILQPKLKKINKGEK